MQENPLVGTWKLVSREIHYADGSVIYPWGRDLTGYLLYSKDGHMSVAFMSANRPHLASDDIEYLGEADAEELARCAQIYVSYCGTYELREDKVIHHIEVCLVPNWIGQYQERLIELVADQLILFAPYQYKGVEATGYMRWKRA